jgi:hypothetical protein
MEEKFHSIIELLTSLSKGQCFRLLDCIRYDEGLVICVGAEREYILQSVKDIQSIINGSNGIFISELKENEKFASTFKSVIYRIVAPDDQLMDFLDFRMENWPEE